MAELTIKPKLAIIFGTGDTEVRWYCTCTCPSTCTCTLHLQSHIFIAFDLFLEFSGQCPRQQSRPGARGSHGEELAGGQGWGRSSLVWSVLKDRVVI